MISLLIYTFTGISFALMWPELLQFPSAESRLWFSSTLNNQTIGEHGVSCNKDIQIMKYGEKKFQYKVVFNDFHLFFISSQLTLHLGFFGWLNILKPACGSLNRIYSSTFIQQFMKIMETILFWGETGSEHTYQHCTLELSALNSITVGQTGSESVKCNSFLQWTEEVNISQLTLSLFLD